MDTSLLDQIKKYEQQNSLRVAWDQYFIINPEVFSKIIDIAQINKNDIVLEVGPGLGFLTRELAKIANEVLAIEIDQKFKPYLSDLPSNTNLIFDDAYKLLNNKQFTSGIKRPTKVVSNIPYSRAQNMLHNYTNSSWYQGDLVWLAPVSLVHKVNNEFILSAYFKAELIEIVEKDDFYPEPNTTSGILLFRRIPDPLITKDFQIYFRRWLYNHEVWKVKNVLREGIINAAMDLKNMKITKKQAKEQVDHLNIPLEQLEVLTNNIKPQYYFEIPEKLLYWFNEL